MYEGREEGDSMCGQRVGHFHDVSFEATISRSDAELNIYVGNHLGNM